jgi:penicillin-binding protein 1C
MPIHHFDYHKSPQQKRWHEHNLHIRKKRLKLRSWGWLLATLFLTGSLIMVGLFAWASRDLPTPEGIARRVVPLSTKIYDRTGVTVLYDIHGSERRTAVGLKDIPDYLKWATITAEDRTFYTHSGFKFTSMLRALFVDLVQGGKLQGGSTITQQFIKNAIVGGEKSYLRKIKELILAYQIEKKFSKDEILKLYLNEIPYGSNAYGVEAAAQTFFGKPAHDLNLSESTLLASLPKATNYYSPWGSHRDELIARQHYIIDAMVELGYIKEAEAVSAKKFELKFQAHRENITAPHFVFYIKELLAEKYGERTVEQGGLKIITTLDLDKQKMAEESITASAKKNLSFNAANASLVALDVPTNQILAMVGSRDYFDDKIAGQVNVSTRPRQPGSSFKPIVYATAFSEGFTPETILFDVVTNFKTDTKDYTPHDYDDKERGPLSLRQALAGSLNIPAVKLLYLTGIDRVLETAQKLGYTTLNDRSRFGLSLVLGGAEVSLLEHTSTYATFAREGITKPVIGILKVEDSQGNTLEEYKEQVGERVLSEQTTRTLTNVLSDNQARSFIFGAQNYLTLPDRLVAAKTGTTNDFRDAWTLGYTSQLAVGVWVGNSNNTEMKKGADGSVLAAPIWQDFFKRANKNLPVQEFISPELQSGNKPILNGQLGELITLDKLTGKRATDLTPEDYRVSKIFKQYHTILRYITPGDPLGATPQNPEQDPQYANWETAVRNWAEVHGLYDESVPNEFDDIHTSNNRPEINIVSPGNNQTVTLNPLPISVQTNSSRPIKQVRYFLDNQEVGISDNFPYSLSLPITTNWANGFHNLKAVVYDDIGNYNSSNTTFNLLVTPLPSTQLASFVNLQNNQEISFASLPYQIKIKVNDPTKTKQIDLYATLENGDSEWLGVNTILSDEISFNWTPTKIGNYKLSLTIKNNFNATIGGQQINISVTQ